MTVQKGLHEQIRNKLHENTESMESRAGPREKIK